MTGLARPTPYSWSVGDVITQTLLNGIRDGLTWGQNPPLFVGTQSSAQSIPTGSWNSLAFNSNVIDTYSGHSTTVNNSRYVGQQPGYYAVGGCTAFAANATSFRAVSVALNGTIVKGSVSWWVTADPGDGIAIPVPVTVVFLNGSTDYVELKTAQSSGGALNTDAAADLSPTMTVWWLHA